MLVFYFVDFYGCLKIDVYIVSFGSCVVIEGNVWESFE